jgi:5-methylcytosine-specific restriction endonuclease McrA
MATTLLLNADCQPVSFLPLSVVSWEDAIKYMVLDKASVIEWYDDWIVRSANWETRVPAVIMLHEYMKCKTTVRFSKQNVFLRDDWTCQYCATPLSEKTATMDHVLPISKGGKTSFLNIVAACPTCNSLKGNDHRVIPKKKPYKPDYWELVNKRKKRPFAIRHNSWRPYIEPHIHHKG